MSPIEEIFNAYSYRWLMPRGLDELRQPHEQMLDFKGTTFDPHLDYDRLKSQQIKIYACLFRNRHRWQTVDQIRVECGLPPTADVTRRIRQVRDEKIIVTARRHPSNPTSGVWIYRIGKHAET